MNQLQIFNNSTFGNIRTIEREGKAWLSTTNAARLFG